MADTSIERMTVTLTPAMAKAVRGAVQAGEYASNSEIFREALRDWRYKREVQARKLMELRDDVEVGLADVRAGGVEEFDAEEIIRKGEERLGRSRST